MLFEEVKQQLIAVKAKLKNLGKTACFNQKKFF